MPYKNIKELEKKVNGAKNLPKHAKDILFKVININNIF